MNRFAAPYWIALLALLVVFQLGSSPAVPQFLGFAGVPWSGEGICGNESSANGTELVMQLGGRHARRSCTSAPFRVPEAEMFEVEYEARHGRQAVSMTVTLQSLESDATAEIDLELPGARYVTEGVWANSAILPANLRGHLVRLVLNESHARERASFASAAG